MVSIVQFAKNRLAANYMMIFLEQNVHEYQSTDAALKFHGRLHTTITENDQLIRWCYCKVLHQ